MNKSMPMFERFLEKINFHTENGCWEWMGFLENGYGGIVENHSKKYKAHRISYEIFFGVKPQEKFVCHKCDNPGCVNPSHLFIGTVNDNNQDKVKKGRQTSFPGSKNPQSKLDETIARKIKQETVVGDRVGYNNGSNVKEIAKKYNVHTETVRLIARGITWKHI